MQRKPVGSVLILAALAVALAGCGSSAPSAKTGPAAEADARLEIHKTFGALQTAIKERNGTKTYSLLDADSRQDADRVARTVKEMFAKADAGKKAELAKNVGLPESKFENLDGKLFLESDLFFHSDEHDELPDVKALDKVDVAPRGETAKIEFKDPDNPSATSRMKLVREEGFWRFQMAMPKVPE